VVCIGVTGGGGFNVAVPNTPAVNITSLEVGGGSSSSSLTIGTTSSGTVVFGVSGAVQTAVGSTIVFGYGGTMTASTLTNAGTFAVPNSGYGGTINVGNTTNTGTFSVAGNASLLLGSLSTFANSGTISTASGTLAVSSPSGSTGTLQLQPGGVVDNGTTGSINVADTVALGGGSICGNPLKIGSGDGGSGGTLAFATSPGSGPACGPGLASNMVLIANVTATMSGTIPSGYTVTAGDAGSGYLHLALSGNVVNNGTFAPGFGATVSASSSSDSLTNNGAVTVQTSGYTTALNFPLVNQGQLTFGAATTASLSNGWTWQNTSTGTITVPSGVTVGVSTPTGQSGAFTQAGVIEALGAFNVGAAVTINGGTTCGNGLNIGSGDGGTGGALSFAPQPTAGPPCPSGQATDVVSILNVTATLGTNIPAGYTVPIGDQHSSYANVNVPGGLTNAGTLEPGWGATLTVVGTLNNVGKIVVPASAYSTTIAGNLSNGGTLDLGTTRLTLNGNYIQRSNGQLSVTINGRQAGGTGFGQLGVLGPAALAGALTIQVAAGFVPTPADTFEIVQAKSLSGQFASVTVQGGTGSSFAYAPNYASSAVSLSSALPPPVLGKTENVALLSGIVFVRLPGHAAGDQEHGALSKGQGFIPLTAARQLPSGSQIDSRLGTLSVASAASTGHGKPQVATLGGAIFGVSQSAHGLTKGLTTFALLEGDFPGAPSYTNCRRHAADHGSLSARAAKASPTVLQTLKASDNHGKFRTRGRYSAATVRGTQWVTQDRCDGTLTIVKRGTVSVFSTVTRRTVTVHAGHSFLARA
jgi:hypothetical protein